MSTVLIHQSPQVEALNRVKAYVKNALEAAGRGAEYPMIEKTLQFRTYIWQKKMANNKGYWFVNLVDTQEDGNELDPYKLSKADMIAIIYDAVGTRETAHGEISYKPTGDGDILGGRQAIFNSVMSLTVGTNKGVFANRSNAQYLGTVSTEIGSHYRLQPVIYVLSGAADNKIAMTMMGENATYHADGDECRIVYQAYCIVIPNGANIFKFKGDWFDILP